MLYRKYTNIQKQGHDPRACYSTTKQTQEELQITAQDYKMITACFLTSDKEADPNQGSRHHDVKPDGACYISSSCKVEW